MATTKPQPEIVMDGDIWIGSELDIALRTVAGFGRAFEGIEGILEQFVDRDWPYYGYVAIELRPAEAG